MGQTLKYLTIAIILLTTQIFSQREINLKNITLHNIPNELLNEISVHLEKATMQAALNEISNKSNLKLNYNSDIIPLDSKVSINVDNVHTVEALLLILEQTSSTLQITKNGSLIILPAKKEVKKGQIKGSVVDASTNEPLIGANVIIEGTSIGAAADTRGEFVLPNVKEGNYKLKISYVGYKEKIENVTVVANRITEIVVKLDWIAVEGNEVIVTAQAKGQLSAINEQLSADEIKNVVSKDRIRELPDANAAESVGRLPGVSVLRSGGEGNKVVIRGLQPKYSKIMVDGVSLAPTSSGDRSVSMGMISSYSLEGIEVIKSPTANMDGDQVGGSVNFVMKIAPKGFNYEIIAQGGYNGLKNTYSDYMFVGNVSNRFFGNKLGVFAQFTSDRKNQSSNTMGAKYYLNEKDINTINTLYTNSLVITDEIRNRNRLGGTLTLDYNLPNGKVYFKNFLSSGETSSQRYRERFSVSGRDHTFYAADKLNKQLIYNNILNYEQNFDLFKLNAKIAHSYSKSEIPNNIMFDFVIDNDIASEIPLNIDPIEIANFVDNNIDDAYWRNVEDNESVNEGRQTIASIDFKTDFSLTNQINGYIQFGGKYKYVNRFYDINGYGGKMHQGNGTEIKNQLIKDMNWNVPLGTKKFPYELFIDKNFKYGEFLNGDYSLGPVANIDVMHKAINFMRNYNFYNPSTYDYLKMSSVINDYSGKENYSAGYFMMNINITNKIKFIPGIRYESNKTEYTAPQGFSTSPKPEDNYPYKDSTTVRNNNYWLPMIHLQYKPAEWIQIRAAYTKTLSRPDFATITPRKDIGVETIKLNNYNLKPEQSESYDLMISFNENHLGLVTIGGFWKNITDKIFNRGTRIILNPAEYKLKDIYKNYFIETQENNNLPAIVKGVELDWQTNFWYLPSFLKGIVLNVNYTRLFSKAYYPRTVIKSEYLLTPPYGITYSNNDTTYVDRLLSQPEHTFNLGLGYDYNDFSIRVSMFYQSNIFAKTNFWPELRGATDDYLRWDLSLQQKLPWYGLQVFLNFTNITAAIERDINIVTKKPTSMSHYGKGIQLGIRIRRN